MEYETFATDLHFIVGILEQLLWIIEMLCIAFADKVAISYWL